MAESKKEQTSEKTVLKVEQLKNVTSGMGMLESFCPECGAQIDEITLKCTKCDYCFPA